MLFLSPPLPTPLCCNSHKPVRVSNVIGGTGGNTPESKVLVIGSDDYEGDSDGGDSDGSRWVCVEYLGLTIIHSAGGYDMGGGSGGDSDGSRSGGVIGYLRSPTCTALVAMILEVGTAMMTKGS